MVDSWPPWRGTGGGEAAVDLCLASCPLHPGAAERVDELLEAGWRCCPKRVGEPKITRVGPEDVASSGLRRRAWRLGPRGLPSPRWRQSPRRERAREPCAGRTSAPAFSAPSDDGLRQFVRGGRSRSSRTTANLDLLGPRSCLSVEDVFRPGRSPVSYIEKYARLHRWPSSTSVAFSRDAGLSLVSAPGGVCRCRHQGRFAGAALLASCPEARSPRGVPAIGYGGWRPWSLAGGL